MCHIVCYIPTIDKHLGIDIRKQITLVLIEIAKLADVVQCLALQNLWAFCDFLGSQSSIFLRNGFKFMLAFWHAVLGGLVCRVFLLMFAPVFQLNSSPLMFSWS